MPLKRRLPKKGFTNIFKKKYAILNLDSLNRFEKNIIVDVDTLMSSGIVRKVYDGIKILGKGKIDKPLTLKAHKFSKSAKEKIELAGGKAEVIKS